jgi:hypothetical protein
MGPLSGEGGAPLEPSRPIVTSLPSLHAMTAKTRAIHPSVIEARIIGFFSL